MIKEKKMPGPNDEVLAAIAALEAKVMALASTQNAMTTLLNAAVANDAKIASKLHDTQALVLQTTRSITNG